jgi:hypothetical protein
MPALNAATLPLALAARTATTVSPQMRNRRHNGVQIALAVSVASGTGGLTLHVRGYDSTSGAAYDLLVDGAAIIATGEYVFVVQTSVGAAGAGIRATANRPLPKLWDIQIVHGDASSYTYSVNAVLLAL